LSLFNPSNIRVRNTLTKLPLIASEIDEGLASVLSLLSQVSSNVTTIGIGAELAASGWRQHCTRLSYSNVTTLGMFHTTYVVQSNYVVQKVPHTVQSIIFFDMGTQQS
jgi:hypothetical protein